MFLGKKNSNQNKYHSSNYISDTKMKLSDENHSLQLNQYFKNNNLLAKKTNTEKSDCFSGKNKRKLRARESEGRLTRWWRWEAWE